MAKHKKRTRTPNRDPTANSLSQKRSVMLCSKDAWTVLCEGGYKPLTECSEVKMCINAYARAVATMTIHLMRNVKNGDVRVKNELSRKVDINPAPYMGRTNLMYMIVRQMMEQGNMVLYPEYKRGYLEWIRPLPPSKRQLVEDGDGYHVRYNDQQLMPDEVVNFVYNPDPERPWKGLGVTVDVGEMVKALRQAGSTRQSLLESPAPSIIVKVTDLAQDFKKGDAQDRLTEKYVQNAKDGKPWFIPAEAMDVTTIKPLSLTDLAIKDNLELDKRAVAAMLGIPAFMVGVGAYNEQEYNNFVSTKLPFVTQIIEQELTEKLLLSPDLYFRLNKRSLMAYALNDLTTLGKEMTDRMALRRNEWRELLGFPPDDEMDELLALENYIPADKLADQKKLINTGKGGEGDGTETDPPDNADDESAAADK